MSFYSIVAQGAYRGTNDQLNVHYYDFNNEIPDSLQLQAFVDAVDSAYKTRLQAFIASNVTMTGYEVRRIDLADQPTAIYVPTAGQWNGTSTGNPLPAFNAALVTFRSFTTFPRTSRSYLQTTGSSNISSQGTLGGSYITALGAWAGDMLTINYGGSDVASKVCANFTSNPRIIDQTNVITTFEVSNLFSPLTKRKQGSGS